MSIFNIYEDSDFDSFEATHSPSYSFIPRDMFQSGVYSSGLDDIMQNNIMSDEELADRARLELMQQQMSNPQDYTQQPDWIEDKK